MPVRLSRRKIANYYADALIKGVDKKQLARELAALLIDSGRTKEREVMTRDIEHTLAARGIVVADVVSAHELTNATMQAIVTMAKSELHATSVEIRSHIEPSILGGVKIDMAGLQIDGTIQQRLIALRSQYKI